MRRVLVSSRSFGTISTKGVDKLRRSGFEILNVPAEQRPLTREKLKQLIARENPDVVVCGAEPIDAEVIDASRHLGMIMKHGVGVDSIDIAAATARGIPVAYAPGTNTEAVSDLVVALMLVLLRGLCRASSSTRSGRWERFVGHELGDLTVGVVGTGRIGSSVVAKLQGFGTDVVACDVVQNTRLSEELRCRYVSLDELLADSDMVTLHVPLMSQTKMMIGERELKLMKPTAYLVNVARGELVDESALYRHLKSAGIAGAALDVFSTEPPQQSPLLTLDNVLATPHIAAYTFESMDRMDLACAETIVEVLAGKIRENLLNPEVFQRQRK